MKKILKLNETQLLRLIKKMVKEQKEMDEPDGKDFKFDDEILFLKNASFQKVQSHLSRLPESITFITIVHCEGADFSEIDLCEFPNLLMVNLKGTPNNFEEVVDCEYRSPVPSMYEFTSKIEDVDY